MSATLTFWLVIVAVGALNYLSRLSFIALFARVEMPAFVARALRYVPAAMLAAIIVPPVALRGMAEADAGLAHAKIVAALVAALVASRLRSITATIAAGMVTLWSVEWLLRTVA